MTPRPSPPGPGHGVIRGAPLPPGWVGKQWALQQGLEVARGEFVLALDADARPRPGLAAALVAAAAGGPFDLVSAGPRFRCDSAAEQALHAALLATLVYRFGPIGPARQPPPHRLVLNGQCLLARRALAGGRPCGFAPVRGHLTDDIALGRALGLARLADRLPGLGRDLLEVDMHVSAAEVWREWGRSLPMADVTSAGWQAADLAVLGLTTALPLARLLGRRATALDLGLLALRGSRLGPLRGSYARPGPGLYCSPLADILAFARMTGATLRPVRTWRGRSYPAARTAAWAAAVRRSRDRRRRLASAAIPNRSPMSDISAPVAATRSAGANSNCSTRGREHPGPGAHRERPGGQGHGRAQRDAEGEGGRAQHGEPAREGEHAAAAAQPGEGGPGVPRHGRGDGHVRREFAAEAQAQQPGGGALERVPGQYRDRAGPAELVLHVPEARVPVAYPARVEPAGAGDEHGHRYRAEGVTAGRGGQPGVNHDRLIPSHPLPAPEGRPRRQPDGLRPPGAGRDRRPAVLPGCSGPAGARP